jgi:hypothetical protein
MNTLLVSGCSFTFDDFCWPNYVGSKLDLKVVNVGMGAAGNGMISKRLISTCENLLKSKKPEEIIVGIMWSGPDRHHQYIEEKRNPSVYHENGIVDSALENPTWAGDKQEKHWLIFNPWTLKSKERDLYYKYVHTDIESQTRTLEYILMTQWYLERKGIKYFMSTYKDIFSPYTHNFDATHPDIFYLYNQVNFDKFLPVDGCLEWVQQNYPEKGFPEVWDDHPSTFGHEKFANEVINPYIKKWLI